MHLVPFDLLPLSIVYALPSRSIPTPNIMRTPFSEHAIPNISPVKNTIGCNKVRIVVWHVRHHASLSFLLDVGFFLLIPLLCFDIQTSIFEFVSELVAKILTLR